MSIRIVAAARAELRLREAISRLAALPPGDEVIVVGATLAAANELVRAVTMMRGSAFGMHRLTLGRFAGELAKLPLADAQLAPIGALPLEAMCARVIDRLRAEGTLGRFAAVADQPGLPRALARTINELRLAHATTAGEPLDAALAAFADELARGKLADRADVLALASRVADHPLLGHHVILLDVPVRDAAERELVAAIAAHSKSLLATVPLGDDRTLARLSSTLGVAPEAIDVRIGGSLERVQRGVFAPERTIATLDDSLAIFSAPGESRECVEIARRIVRTAEAGVPFDRIAILLRAPAQYRVHLEEALARAGVPAYFERGTVLPDPAGRAFVALLACAAEGLSARRFAEYLSLGEVPGDVAPAAAPRGDRWVPPDEDLLPRALVVEPSEQAEPDAIATRAPWRWERLLVDAAVIGGRERWTRRLDGLAARLALDEPDERRDRAIADLEHLRAFALPLLDELAALPRAARWGQWLDALSALATRALRRPDRVLAVLAALSPMAEIGPVELGEVQIVLAPRLTELVAAAPASRYGRVLVAPIASARGMAFDVAFVPGLAERMFPQKLVEDPLLLDAERARLSPGLETRVDRLAEERLALRLAIGAASRRVVLSYPRIDLDQARPRVPSFYGLEVLAAAEGKLPGFEELGQRADVTGAARIGWPAPSSPFDAIDEAEHDLALLDQLVGSRVQVTGAARYLLGANAHLARALRARGRRWEVKSWKPADGFIASSPAAPEVRAVLDANSPTARSFSPTALEQLATCPLRFAYRTIAGLAPRDVPEPIQAIGALERGSLVHEVQFELLGELRDAGELPVRAPQLDSARARLDGVLDRVAARYRDDLAPAIERVWADGIASIRADLREWLRRMAEDLDWTPRRFELAFGLAQKLGRDPASVDAPVALDIGLMLRGSIDLVEQRSDGAMRATDHKTGKARVEAGSLIAGGASLQPVFYALVLERLFPGKLVAGGRLAYCTTRGDFKDVDVPLDDDARAAAQLVATTLAHHLAEGFFPAAPSKGACDYCDYRPVCGPYEELRARRKDRDKLVPLARLRDAK
ncbi:MAG TPA: PD-(D/E)XK nuclease family protein [Kofleriaceae bacterium]|nr:PD-(D/E)XK nuclease family protein [Kofleriaceae bacterium]